MMRTAGVEPTITYFEAVNPLAEISSGKLVTKERNFTAEKQLEIIKLIGFSDYSISIYKKGRGAISVAVEPNTFKYSYSARAQDFTKALAELTTELMKANELDKEKVKGILEGC